MSQEDTRALIARLRGAQPLGDAPTTTRERPPRVQGGPGGARGGRGSDFPAPTTTTSAVPTAVPRRPTEEEETQRTASDRQAASELIERILELIRNNDPSVQFDRQILEMLQRELNLLPTEAQDIFTAFIDDINEVRIETAPQRFNLIEEQGDKELLRRGVELGTGQPLGTRSPLAQQALGSAFNTFKQQDPLLNFGSPGAVEEGERFASFLGGAQTDPNILQQRLGSILDSAQGEILSGQFDFTGQKTPGGEFVTRFRKPNDALTAALQPLLARVSPRLRGPLLDTLLNSAGFSTRPEDFDDPEEILRLMRTIFLQGQQQREPGSPLGPAVPPTPLPAGRR